MNEELPKGWAWTKIGEVAETSLGKMLDRAKNTGEHKVPYLRNVNVQWGRIDLDDVLSMEIPPDKQEFFRLRRGDLLVCEGGEVGRCAIWPGGDSYMAFQKALHRVRPFQGIEVKFLLYLFEYLSATGKLLTYATGSTIKHLPQQKLRGIKFGLPPLAEQRRIVGVLESELSRLDAAKTLVDKSSARVESLWGAVLEGVVEGSLLHGPGRHYEYYPVSDCVIVQGGIQKQAKRRPVENKYPFLRVANVQRGYVDLAEIHEVELFDGELEKYRLESGDLLVVEGNGSPQHIGRGAMWRGGIADAVHQNHLIRLRPTAKFRPEFLELVWNSSFVGRQLRDVASSTSGLMTLSVAKIKRIKVPLPSVEEQDKIVCIAESWRARVDAARNSAQRVQRRANVLRQALLSSAFSGKLVPQDPSDEPAAVLLKKIRSECAAASKPKRARRSTTKPLTRLASTTDVRTPEDPQPVHAGEQTALEF